MTDTITLPRATVQQALEALEWSTPFQDATVTHSDAITALRAALEQKAEPVYKDSTPHLHVGDSAFEAWFQAQPFATQAGIKQISRDSYAAGMGDPLVVAAPQQQAEPVCPDCKAAVLYECVACSSNNYPPQQQAEPVQEPFDGLATELFVVAQRSPADDGFSDTIDRIESWLREHFSTPPQRKELSAGEILNMMPSTIPAQYDGELMEFARAVETKIKEGT